MTNIFIKDLENHLSQEVLLKGWIFNSRSSGNISFLEFRDGTGLTQGIVEKGNVTPQIWDMIEKITPETSAEITGVVTKHPRRDQYEIQVKDIKIIQFAAADYPITKKEHGVDFLMTHRHLWLRSSRQIAIQRIRNTIILAMYDFLGGEGFTKIDAPILTPNACEGTTTLFELDYFDGEKAYLSQSGQLYLETAIFAVGRCFDFGPVFRAEKSKTRRHLNEFWMLDAEMPFCDYRENMQIQEGLVMHIVKKVLEENLEDLKILERNIEKLEAIQAPFIHMTYVEAIEKLHELGSDIKKGEDFGNDDETMLTNAYDRPIFIEKFPAAIKAFYMPPDPENPEYALCNDLLAPEGYGEVIGGSQRIDDYDFLLKRIQEHQLPVEAFQWYLDLRKYGSVPHSGFGIGLERAVAWICGLDHVRETIPFARTLNRLYP